MSYHAIVWEKNKGGIEMRFLKNFNIWWSWFISKHRRGWAMPIVGILMIFSAVGALAFFGSFFLNGEAMTISPIKIRIIAGILTPILFYLYFNAFMHIRSSENFRVAIDEAKEFAEENSQCLPKINLLTQETRETKNPAKINEWIMDWRKLSSQKAEMQELKKRKEDIEKGIPLNEVNTEIEATQRIINELESKLA